MFEIDTVKPYPADYDKCTKVAQKEQRENARPEIVDCPEDLDKYDTVFVGYPNWWNTMPMAVFTFLEKYDLTGKRIIPFCTNEGSGMGRSESDLKIICKGATVEKGLPITGSNAPESESQVGSWLKKLGF